MTTYPPLPDTPTGVVELPIFGLCLTMGDPGAEWHLVNSLFQVSDTVVAVHFANLANPAGVVSQTFRATSMPQLASAVCAVPGIIQALSAGPSLWRVFGKANLVDPLFHLAYAKGFAPAMPYTEDVIGRWLGPSMLPTAQDREKFSRSFCHWLTSRNTNNPLELF